MKNFLFLLAFAGLVVACQKTELTGDLTAAEGGMVAGGGNGCDSTGHGFNPCLRGDSISIDSLPALVADYVAANYAGAAIVSAKSNPRGFSVELSTGVVLLFDKTGAFKRECTGQPGNPGGPGNPQDSTHTGNPCLRGHSISVDSLPAGVNDYVAANYAGSTIVSAVAKKFGAIAVELSTGEVLIFKADGTFVTVCTGEAPGNPGGPHHGPGGPHGPHGHGGNGNNGGRN